jgi:hypothetical protein
MANLGQNCKTCNQELTLENCVIARRKNDCTNAYRTECKKCHSALVRSKRGHKERKKRTHCVDCKVELNDDNSCFQKYKKRSGVMSLTRKSRCKECHAEYNKKCLEKMRDEKTRTCEKCGKTKRGSSFKKKSSKVCTPCLGYGYKSATKKPLKVEKPIKVKEVEVIGKKPINLDEVSKRNEKRILEEQDFLVRLDKDIDYISPRRVDRTIVRPLTDDEQSMIAAFKSKNAIKKDEYGTL